MPSDNAFALRLSAFRGRAKINRSTLARMTGIPTKTLAQFEEGESEPSWTQVQLIAKAFGKSVLSFRDPALRLPGARLYKTV
jgi:DNA-binding XRE family transcriptional regulator